MLLEKVSFTDEAREHFGLMRTPFPDDVQSVDEVFLTPNIRRVRRTLLECAQQSSFIAIVGESGSGKSTLAAELEERIKLERREIAVIRPYVLASEQTEARGKRVQASHLAEAITHALDSHAPRKSSPQDRFMQMHDLLKASTRTGRKHLLLIEEAHDLPITTLKHLKRLLELKDGLRRLLSVALIAQPELRKRLNSQNPEVREVMQRCEIVELAPLGDDLQGFLAHKFGCAGLKLDDVFDTDPKASAMDAIHARLTAEYRDGRRVDAYSVCYPLVVQNLVTRAMNAAAALHWPKVDAQVIAGC